jgi:fluoride exporter
LKEFLYIFIGGGAGSVLRYLFSKGLNLSYQLPLGTLLVNVVGSLILGFLLGYILKNNSTGPLVLLLTVGFCGGFTTFSAFAVENLSYLKNGDFLLFAAYSLLSLILSILAVFGGFLLVKSLSI